MLGKADIKDLPMNITVTDPTTDQRAKLRLGKGVEGMPCRELGYFEIENPQAGTPRRVRPKKRTPSKVRLLNSKKSFSIAIVVTTSRAAEAKAITVEIVIRIASRGARSSASLPSKSTTKTINIFRKSRRGEEKFVNEERKSKSRHGERSPETSIEENNNNKRLNIDEAHKVLSPFSKKTSQVSPEDKSSSELSDGEVRRRARASRFRPVTVTEEGTIVERSKKETSDGRRCGGGFGGAATTGAATTAGSPRE